MSVAKVIEVTATSTESFDDAVKVGIQKSGETLRNIRGAWVSEQKVDVEDGLTRTIDWCKKLVAQS